MQRRSFDAPLKLQEKVYVQDQKELSSCPIRPRKRKLSKKQLSSEEDLGLIVDSDSLVEMREIRKIAKNIKRYAKEKSNYYFMRRKSDCSLKSGGLEKKHKLYNQYPTQRETLYTCFTREMMIFYKQKYRRQLYLDFKTGAQFDSPFYKLRIDLDNQEDLEEEFGEVHPQEVASFLKLHPQLDKLVMRSIDYAHFDSLVPGCLKKQTAQRRKNKLKSNNSNNLEAKSKFRLALPLDSPVRRGSHVTPVKALRKESSPVNRFLKSGRNKNKSKIVVDFLMKRAEQKKIEELIKKDQMIGKKKQILPDYSRGSFRNNSRTCINHSAHKEKDLVSSESRREKDTLNKNSENSLTDINQKAPKK